MVSWYRSVNKPLSNLFFVFLVTSSPPFESTT
jgi:hypothetical protein